MSVPIHTSAGYYGGVGPARLWQWHLSLDKMSAVFYGCSYLGRQFDRELSSAYVMCSNIYAFSVDP